MLTDAQWRFLSTAAGAAVVSERDTGVPAEITLAQAILESGWGKASPGFNCFGIKDSDRRPGCQYCITREFVDGTWKMMKLAFEVYPDLSACFTDHAKLISGGFDPKKTNAYWPHFRLYQQDKDLRGYLWGISAHYATDPKYPQNIMALLRMAPFQDALARAVANTGKRLDSPGL